MAKKNAVRNVDAERSKRLRQMLTVYVNALTEPMKRMEIEAALHTKLEKLGLPSGAVANSLRTLRDNQTISGRKEGRDWIYWSKSMPSLRATVKGRRANVAGQEVQAFSDARPLREPDLNIDLIKGTNRARITLKGGTVIEVGAVAPTTH